MKKFWIYTAMLLVVPILAAAQDAAPAQAPRPGMGPGMRFQGSPPATGPQFGGPQFGGPQFRGPQFGRPMMGPGPRLGGRQFGPGFRARGAMGMRRGGGMGRLVRELNLTDAQKTKLRQMRFDRQKAAIQNRATLQTRQLELRQLMSGDKPDKAAIDRKIDEIGQARTAQMKARLDTRLAIRDLLTPEQQKKLRQLREQRGRGPAEAGAPPAPGTPRGPGPRRQPNAPPPAPKPAPES